MMYLKHMGLSNDHITLKSGSINTKSWILLNTFFQALQFFPAFIHMHLSGPRRKQSDKFPYPGRQSSGCLSLIPCSTTCLITNSIQKNPIQIMINVETRIVNLMKTGGSPVLMLILTTSARRLLPEYPPTTTSSVSLNIIRKFTYSTAGEDLPVSQS